MHPAARTGRVDEKIRKKSNMLARSICFLGLVALLGPTTAFTQPAHTGVSLKRPSPSEQGPPCHRRHHQLLLAEEPSSAENEPSTAAASVPSQYDDGDPRQALEQFGSLFTQVQAIFVEGNNWDSDTLEAKTEEFVRTYLRVFVPGIGYAVTSFTVFGSSFAFVLLALSISGRGYNDILGAVGGIDLLRGLLEKADPAWGNAAIALLGCELLSPVILGATLALTPSTIEALQAKVDDAGWGEDDIEERTAEILNLTS